MKRIAKVLGITSIISALHLVEDVVLFIIGRYTDVTIFVVLIGVLTLSLTMALLSRMERVKKFLGS
tara:strand:- start:201 stop:398 length:198 start_codon:yes stop_codon:yes gene_type:complete